MTARRVPRSRLLSVVAGLVMVTVAAIGFRSSEPGDFAVVRGTLGEPAPYADGSVVVDAVQVGTVLVTSTNDRVTTPGMFVVVRAAARATGREGLRLNHLQLLAEGATYLPTKDDSLAPAPGLEESHDLWFEVDPARIDDLTLEAWGTQGFVEGYATHVRVPLGVTAANADQWRRAAQGAEVTYVLSSTYRGVG